MGVQQFDRELFSASGRKQDLAHVLAMLEYCQLIGLGSNVDLQVIVDHRIPHLTHYELNVAGRSDSARHRHAVRRAVFGQ
jgi:oxygen-independent coproporphyrinogen-3 oxidase